MVSDEKSDLIAAAPDLLEALKQAAHEFDVLYASWKLVTAKEMAERCRAAIAKAEGKP